MGWSAGLRGSRESTTVPADQPDVIVTAKVDDPSAPVIALSGELDLATVEATRESINQYLSSRPIRVTFDLEKLTFMDSSGIALLVQISNAVDHVTLVHVAPIVHRVLEATGLLEHFGLAT
jgi:anti-sigma B factor antagonist